MKYVMWNTETHERYSTEVLDEFKKSDFLDDLAEFNEDLAHRLRLGLVVWKTVEQAEASERTEKRLEKLLLDAANAARSRDDAS